MRPVIKVLQLDEDGPTIAAEADALDIIGQTYGEEIDLVAIPVARLDPSFFDLRSGLAGALLQKFINYRFQVAILGDIHEWVAASGALRDFVYESNRGRQVWFLADRAELDQRLTPVRSAAAR